VTRVLLLAATAAFLAGPVAAEPLAVHNGRLFIAAKVNGVPTEALLDSGAEATLLDPALARAAGIPKGQSIQIKGTGGAQQAEVVSDVTVEALGRKLDKLDAVVLDLGDLSARLIQRPIRAIIGRELFDAARIEVDMAGREVRTVDRAHEPRGQRLPLTRQHGIEAVPVTVGTIEALADLDFGNGTAVLVSQALADRLKLQPTGTARGGGIGGEITRKTVILPSLTIAGRTFRHVPAQIDATPNAGELNIGTSILRHFLVTADYSQRAVWLAAQPTEQK
jgi:predicted aspartyl protease